MKNLRRNVLLLAFLGLVSLIGCSGGGGSSAPVEKDVAGINATISGFMASVANRDSAAASKFLAAETTTSEASLHSLMVYDFGDDINNPNDERNHYQFTISSSDIVQVADNFATVKAYYKLSSGEPLWLNFSLIKESGVWIIETITVGATNTDSASGFVASTYFPITPGAISRYNHYYQGTKTGSTITREFSATPIVKDGINYYRLYDVYNSLAAVSLRAATSGISASEIYYSQQSSGLWVYSPSFNDGVPFKLLEPSHSFGSTHSLQYTSRDSSSALVNHSVSMTFGYPENARTDLKDFQAVPVTFITTTKDSYGESTGKTKIWFAPSYGQVLFEVFHDLQETTAMYSESLYEYIAPSTPATPVTPGSGVTSGSIVFAEGGDSQVVYDLYAGINVNPSTGEFSLRNDGQGPTLIFQTPPSGPFTPTDDIEIFPDVTIGNWNWYPSIPSGYTTSSSGGGIIVGLGTSVNCSLQNSVTGATVSFTARVVANNSKLAIDRRTGDLTLEIANYSFSAAN